MSTPPAMTKMTTTTATIAMRPRVILKSPPRDGARMRAGMSESRDRGGDRRPALVVRTARGMNGYQCKLYMAVERKYKRSWNCRVHRSAHDGRHDLGRSLDPRPEPAEGGRACQRH